MSSTMHIDHKNKNILILGERPTQGFIVCPPPPPPFLLGRGVEPPTKFSKRGSFTGPQLLEGVAGKEGGVTFFRGGGGYINNLKSEIFNDKKSLLAKTKIEWGGSGSPKKGGLGQFTDLKGVGEFKEGWCF